MSNYTNTDNTKKVSDTFREKENETKKESHNGIFYRRYKEKIKRMYIFSKNLIIRIICIFRKDYQGLHYINPKLIKKTVNINDYTLKNNKMWHFGRVSGGDWDLDGYSIKEYGFIYLILKERIYERREFDDINKFRENIHKIKKGETPDNCNTVKKYRKKWQRIETLYKKLKEEGYKSQEELKTGFPFNEIRAQVGRNGELLFEEGIHRLIISQILGFEEIPVIITRRHEKWVESNKEKIYNNHNTLDWNKEYR